MLPFDENTSSNDQAKGRVGGGFVSAGRDAELGECNMPYLSLGTRVVFSVGRHNDATVFTVNLPIFLFSCITGAVMPSPLKGHDRALKQLAQSAMELRSVIRVKMADEADVNQVRL